MTTEVIITVAVMRRRDLFTGLMITMATGNGIITRRRRLFMHRLLLRASVSSSHPSSFIRKKEERTLVQGVRA